MTHAIDITDGCVFGNKSLRCELLPKLIEGNAVFAIHLTVKDI